jgi:alkylresorcinol/alkylpyrone synthase
MSNKAVILAIETANPQYKVDQTTVQDYANIVFGEHKEFLEKMLPVFTNTGIKQRYFSAPMEWFNKYHSFADSNELFKKTAIELSVSAVSMAIESSGLSKNDIGTVIFVCSTGIATPSIDSHIILQCGLPDDCKRIPIWGLGCAGGVSGLAKAGEIASQTNRAVVLVSIELCSLTFQKSDISKSNIIASTLFGDGCAVVVVAPDSMKTNSGTVISNSKSHLFPSTEHIMGWDVTESGLKVRFSRDIPTFITGEIPRVYHQALTDWNTAHEEIKHFVMHPGGTKVLTAYEEALSIPTSALAHSQTILEEYGNMSSCSVLFVLKRHIESGLKGKSVIMALGPGFSAEMVLLDAV